MTAVVDHSDKRSYFEEENFYLLYKYFGRAPGKFAPVFVVTIFVRDTVFSELYANDQQVLSTVKIGKPLKKSNVKKLFARVKFVHDTLENAKVYCTATSMQLE